MSTPSEIYKEVTTRMHYMSDRNILNAVETYIWIAATLSEQNKATLLTKYKMVSDVDCISWRVYWVCLIRQVGSHVEAQSIRTFQILPWIVDKMFNVMRLDYNFNWDVVYKWIPLFMDTFTSKGEAAAYILWHILHYDYKNRVMINHYVNEPILI